MQKGGGKILTWELVKDALLDALTDSVKILPILFLTYLLIEYVEHHMSQRMEHLIRKAGRLGPLFGGALGVIPQCGLSGAAAEFYAARVVSVGTLFSIILATSDEMLPILLSEANRVPLPKILLILGLKFVIGVAVGFAVDAVMSHHRRVEVSEGIGEFGAEHSEGHKHGILRGAVTHSVTIILIIFAVSALLNLAFGAVGEERIAAFFPDIPFVSEMIAALIGLIPNCSASVVLTELYVAGVIGAGPMMAGLLVNGGVALLILWRSNRPRTDSLRITVVLYAVSVLAGTLVGLIPIL